MIWPVVGAAVLALGLTARWLRRLARTSDHADGVRMDDARRAALLEAERRARRHDLVR